MNLPLLLKSLGLLFVILGVAMVVPLGTSVYYGDSTKVSFIWTSSLTLLSGLSMFFLFSDSTGRVTSRGAIILVASVWLSFTVIGALPFYFSGTFENFIDAWFESASGFTTTGASVVSDIEALPPAILVWRSLIQFLGGMGVIVLSVAILPLVGVGGMDLYRAEAPGPKTDKISARISETARALWILYVVFTVIAGLTYYFLGMSPFDAVNHALTTMSTGGFSTKNASMGGFNSVPIEMAASFFMFLGGVNFVLHFRLFCRGDISIHRDPEFRFYLTIVLAAIALMTLSVWAQSGHEITEALRHSIFQVSTLVSSTGYATYDYLKWSPFAQFMILLIMIVGGSAGSTAGGLKCVRVLLLMKQGVRELHQMLHPRAVIPLRHGGERVSPSIASAIFGHCFLFSLIVVVVSLFQTALGIDIITAVSTTISALSNMGPALGSAGPMLNYSDFPDFVKLLLSFCMIVGRLELFTILVLLTSDFWSS